MRNFNVSAGEHGLSRGEQRVEIAGHQDAWRCASSLRLGQTVVAPRTWCSRRLLGSTSTGMPSLRAAGISVWQTSGVRTPLA